MTVDIELNGIKLMVEVDTELNIKTIHVGSEEISDLLEDRHEEIEELLIECLKD